MVVQSRGLQLRTPAGLLPGFIRKEDRLFVREVDVFRVGLFQTRGRRVGDEGWEGGRGGGRFTVSISHFHIGVFSTGDRTVDV